MKHVAATPRMAGSPRQKEPVRGSAIAPISPTRRPPRSSAAIRSRGSATPARWVASWCAASLAIVADLSPRPGEPVIDKPGKGAFYQTDLELVLKNRGITTLLVCGVTTEVCLHTTTANATTAAFAASRSPMPAPPTPRSSTASASR